MKQNCIFTIFLLTIVLTTACSEEKATIEGIGLGSYSHPNTITIFKEDLFGTGLDGLTPYGRENMESSTYYVEAYNIRLTEETKIILEESGEEKEIGTISYENIYDPNFIELRLLLAEITPITVTVDGEFSQKVSTDRLGHIFHRRELLPIYTATEVIIHPLSEELFMMSNMARGASTNLIVITEDDLLSQGTGLSYEQYWNDIEEALDGDMYHLPYPSINIIEADFYELYNTSRDTSVGYPFYYIFNKDGVALTTDDWEEALTVLIENLEEEE